MSLLPPIQSRLVGRGTVQSSPPPQQQPLLPLSSSDFPVVDIAKTYSNYGAGMYSVVLERMSVASNISRLSVPRAIRLLISGIEDCAYFIADLEKALGGASMPPELASVVSRLQTLQQMIVSRIYSMLGKQPGSSSLQNFLQNGGSTNNVEALTQLNNTDIIKDDMKETLSNLGRAIGTKIKGLVGQATQIIQGAANKTGSALLAVLQDILAAKGYLSDARQLNLGLGVLEVAAFESSGGGPVDLTKPGNEQEGDAAMNNAIFALNSQADTILRRINPRLTQYTAPEGPRNGLNNLNA